MKQKVTSKMVGHFLLYIAILVFVCYFFLNKDKLNNLVVIALFTVGVLEITSVTIIEFLVENEKNKLMLHFTIYTILVLGVSLFLLEYLSIKRVFVITSFLFILLVDKSMKLITYSKQKRKGMK